MALLILFATIIVLIVGFSILASYEESKGWEERRKQRMMQSSKHVDFHV